ncbi:pyrroline-5-carboxylate reductase [Telmatospirillum sp.]|uniref:pyrroline-5-carboxylate reductase n=1 Tax=Telmatospirillum sp. TaxID=2079197 RepID=UPI0028457A59|nr:pyrroline-5-carboxylate reductase [Telmatospirillum sp.]MDR3437231.1 pyrroline-5-carboxylate reductase [Telmatospirillum sp.]
MTRVLLVGAGNMGGSLLEGWLDRGFEARDIVVVDPGRQKPTPCQLVDGADAVPEAFAPDVVVFAVKPQIMDKVAPGYARYAGKAVFLSIAAGKTLAYFQARLGLNAALVRAIPNTPAAVRHGITVAVTNPIVDAVHKALCNELLSAVGEVAWVEDEALIDTATAVSGGGPAYVFLLVETLAQAGVAAGLPSDLADQLARVTVSGSGELLARSKEDPAQLRKNVTSPQGTTAAALNVLMGEDGFGPLLTRAVAAAQRRSRELAD